MIDAMTLSFMRVVYLASSPRRSPGLTAVSRRAFAMLTMLLLSGGHRKTLQAAEATPCGGMPFCGSEVCTGGSCGESSYIGCENLYGHCDDDNCWTAMPECVWCCDCSCGWGLECICEYGINHPACN